MTAFFIIQYDNLASLSKISYHFLNWKLLDQSKCQAAMLTCHRCRGCFPKFATGLNVTISSCFFCQLREHLLQNKSSEGPFAARVYILVGSKVMTQKQKNAKTQKTEQKHYANNKFF